ncbi:MAG: IclR family transcriptional regulator [Anaerolineae bacterium]|nr:IclR family transcriptional regulator [Anaerolineae bacterium]
MASLATPQDTNLAQTVLKALDILECIAFADHPLSAAKVAKLCNMSRPTAYRLICTLATRGYVAQEDDTHYRLGTQVLTLSQNVLDSLDLPELARPYLRHLSDITHETVYLSILDDDEILYIGKAESSQSVRTHAKIGSRNLLHCTAMGKAILAFLPIEEQTQLLERIKLTRLTSATITDRAALAKELAKVRTQKYALDNEECEEDIRCVGAPIFDHNGRPFAAISVSGPAYRVTVSRIRELSLLVIDTADTISSRLGYVP